MEGFIQIRDQGVVIRVEIKGAKALNRLSQELGAQFLETTKPVVTDLSDAW